MSIYLFIISLYQIEKEIKHKLLLRFRASCYQAANGVGILILVNVVDHCVHNSLTLVSEIRQLGTKFLSSILDGGFSWSKVLEQNLHDVDSIVANLALAWELDGQSLQLGLRFRASCYEAANGVGILILVNVVDHCVHNSLALVSEIRQLGTKFLCSILDGGFSWSKVLKQNLHDVDSIGANLALAWKLDRQSLQLGLRFRAGCDELANVVGILILVDVVDHCVHKRLALVSEIRQLGTEFLSSSFDGCFSWSEVLQQNLHDVHSIIANLALAWELEGKSLQLLAVWLGSGQANKGNSQNKQNLHDEMWVR